MTFFDQPPLWELPHNPSLERGSLEEPHEFRWPFAKRMPDNIYILGLGLKSFEFPGVSVDYTYISMCTFTVVN